MIAVGHAKNKHEAKRRGLSPVRGCRRPTAEFAVSEYLVSVPEGQGPGPRRGGPGCIARTRAGDSLVGA